MSRVNRYRDSFKDFIKKRLTLENDIEKIKGEILDTSLLLPILAITIINNKKKTAKANFLGYYGAFAVSLFEYLGRIIDSGNTEEIVLCISCIIECWMKNIELAKNNISVRETLQQYKDFNKVIKDKIVDLISLGETQTNNTSDIYATFLKARPGLMKKYKALENKTSNLLKDKVSSVFAILLAWNLGLDRVNNEFVNTLGESFGEIYSLACDCKTIEDDIDKDKPNYILRNGVQKTHEKFLESKKTFIEMALNLDVYTNTVREIVLILEKEFESFINKTKVVRTSDESSEENKTNQIVN